MLYSIKFRQNINMHGLQSINQDVYLYGSFESWIKSHPVNRQYVWICAMPVEVFASWL